MKENIFYGIFLYIFSEREATTQRYCFSKISALIETIVKEYFKCIFTKFAGVYIKIIKLLHVFLCSAYIVVIFPQNFSIKSNFELQMKAVRSIFSWYVEGQIVQLFPCYAF